MNRKNTILIAVLINAGLLAVLLIAALTTQDELPSTAPVVAEAPLLMPKFEEPPLFQERPPLAALEAPKPIELPLLFPETEPLEHKLPPLIAEAPPVVAPAPAVSPPATPLAQVTVKKGDTLDKIAKINHTSVDQLIKLNNLPSTFLKVGQVLKIPTEKSLPKVKELNQEKVVPEYYTLKVGDNAWMIAMKHHMKVEELLRLNGLNEERARKLKPGDRLRIR